MGGAMGGSRAGGGAVAAAKGTGQKPGTHMGLPIQKGPKGGSYVIGSNGQKHYINK